MEEYEKWLNEHFRSICLSQQSKDKMCTTWRGALKWVLSQHCIGNWDDGSALETAIKKELGDT